MIRRWFRLPLVLIMLGTLAAWPGYAQLRTLPQNAKFGRVGASQQLPFVQLDGKLFKLAPGGIIYDENNRSIVHGQIPSGVRVAYSFEMSGDIGKIYILTAQEQALVDSKR
jgi:hypothetical protein